MNNKVTHFKEDRCVCCGAIVPEGSMVCRECENKQESKIKEIIIFVKKETWSQKLHAMFFKNK